MNMYFAQALYVVVFHCIFIFLTLFIFAITHFILFLGAYCSYMVKCTVLFSFTAQLITSEYH